MVETKPSMSTEIEINFKQPECLEHTELKSCDRCYLRCSKIFWNSTKSEIDTRSLPSTSYKIDNKSRNTKKSNSEYFLTSGKLLETGPCGKIVFDLSQQIAKAPSLTPKRRHHVLNQSWRTVQLIEAELGNLHENVKDLLIQKITDRQQGVLQGSSEEFKNAVAHISEKYRNRRAEVNSKCFSQMENLRRQLRADIDFEEKIAKQKTNEALVKRLKEVEDNLYKLGCTGPNFSIPTPDITVQNSTLWKIQFENKFATSMLPIPEGLIKSVREAEKDELQNFLLYARLTNQAEEKEPRKKKFKMELVPEVHGLNGLMEDDDEEEVD